MSTTELLAVPEAGQLVSVRDRQWIVSDVSRGSIASDVLTPATDEPQHLLSLVSIEEDATGEELQVIWELEPGRRVIDRAALPVPDPDNFDPPDRLNAFLDAVRWGAIASADPRHLQAPFRSGIAIEDYQLDPVVRALRMPRVNLLVADDVGLGKTIEAGLVVQELLLRHRARSILVICPASLTIKWQTEMAEKFGLEFRIVDRALLGHLRRTRARPAQSRGCLTRSFGPFNVAADLVLRRGSYPWNVRPITPPAIGIGGRNRRCRHSLVVNCRHLKAAFQTARPSPRRARRQGDRTRRSIR